MTNEPLSPAIRRSLEALDLTPPAPDQYRADEPPAWINRARHACWKDDTGPFLRLLHDGWTLHADGSLTPPETTGGI